MGSQDVREWKSDEDRTKAHYKRLEREITLFYGLIIALLFLLAYAVAQWGKAGGW